jgi:hypothetical protein
MNIQKHKIMRQVLELRGCPESEARRVQSELREACYRRLLPLIDKVCSGLGAPERIDRVERLEIDLGTVPLDALQAAVAEKFEAAFAEKLAAAIGAAPGLDAELELFELFIRTGSVPWWAELSERALLEASLERLIARSPRAVRRAIETAADRERVVRRLARAYSDRVLGRLAHVLAPSLDEAIPEIVAASAARALWWEELLRALLAGAAAPGAEPESAEAAETAESAQTALVRGVVLRIARRLGIQPRLLIEDLRRALSAPSQACEIVARISREFEHERGAEAVQTAQAVPPRLERTMARLEALLEAHLVPGGSPPAARARLLARLREIRRLAPHLQAQAAAALEAEAIEAGIVAPQAARHGATEEIRTEEEAARSTSAPSTSAFSDADEIYVDNAGLVILWPFLQPFFANVGLLEEKAFKDEAARQRAVGLLQYLATGEAPEAEYLLPLNKVLCGLPLEEVFDFGPPPTEAEIEACDDLLRAVIEQAPILNNMSTAGFRASFLLRKGQLGAADGNWRLRVERETHDVVLDRFPWSFPYVKLPWMEAVLQVEW